MKKKIYYIINGRIPTEKANGYQVSQMCQAFVQNGYDVELLRPKRQLLHIHAEFKNNLKEFYNLKDNFWVQDIFSIDFLHYFNKVPGLRNLQTAANLLHSFSFVFNLAIYLFRKTSSGDLLYLRDVNILAWLHPFLRKKIKNTIILELHSFPEKAERRKRYIRILNNARAVICVTNKMKEDLLSLGFPSQKALVQHDGVDLEGFEVKLSQEECRKELKYPENRFIIGYVGNFQTNGKEKGIDDLIRCSGEIIKSFPDTLFYFVGGPLVAVPYYESIIKEYNLPWDNYKFFDRLPVKYVPMVMKACDILTIPFPWNPHFAFYASPMKLFEYMTSGRAIVATDIESIREVLTDGENALLAKHSNLSDLSQTILRAMVDKALREKVAWKAMEEVKNYTWKSRAKRILDFVKGL